MRFEFSLKTWLRRLALASLAAFFPATVQAENRYAILFGVNDYSAESELPALDYAATDVERLRDILLQRGYKSEHIMTLTSKQQKETLPTRANIIRALSGFAETQQMTVDDSVMIVFAGHGFNLNGDSYLCPSDFKASSPATSSIRIAEMAATLADLPAGSKYMVLDACREDSSQGNRREFNLISSLKSMRLKEDTSPQGIMFFSSCLAGQLSYEDPDLQGGVFMSYFCKGLEGAADFNGNHDQKVSAFELSEYASSMTTDHVRKTKGRNQRPWSDTHSTSDLNLCEIPRQVYEEKQKEWGTITRMSPLEHQNREQASELVYDALLRFAGGKNQDSISKLSSAIDIDEKFFMARQFRALLYMVQGNSLTKGKSFIELRGVYPAIAEDYKKAINDMQAVGSELRIPVPDFLDEIELKRGNDVIAKARKGDVILVRNVISENGNHWLDVAAIHRTTVAESKSLKREKFEATQPVYAYLPLLAKQEANEGLIRNSTGLSVSNPTSPSVGIANTRPILDAPRIERAAVIYDRGAGIANQFGAGLPTGFSLLFGR
jgi:hypothetical protein